MEVGMENGKSGTGNILLALLGGAVLGAGIALLYAPQSGRRTREKLRDLSEDAEDFAQDLVAKAKRQGEDLLRKGRECCEAHKRSHDADAA
jgi:gas vesicle protein